MKNTIAKSVWGALFVLLGIALAVKAFGVIDFNIFFPGWWTLFIIVPSACGLVDRGNRAASVFGLGIGLLLLMAVQGIVDWYTFPRLIIALIFVVIGCSFLFRKDKRAEQTDGYYSGNTAYRKESSGPERYGSYGNDNRDNDNRDNGNSDNDNSNNSGSNYTSSEGNNKYSSNNSNYYNNSSKNNQNGSNHYTGFLSGRNVQFVDEVFTGAEITSILGNVQLDLRNAIFNDDVVVETTCILGGIDIYVPNSVKVVMNCTPVLGGVESKVVTPYNATGIIHTIFIRGTCILGGIEVK